jgi:adenylate cyclase
MAEDRVQRRLAAILAADVVGYSRLMEIDETGTLHRLKALRHEIVDPCIASHRGRIVKLMGDGLLAEFASIVDAVECAIMIQRASARVDPLDPSDRRLLFRIGVNLGDVIVDDNDIYGEGVNVAARLQSLARPGGIAVSGTVHEHIGGKVATQFEDFGQHSVKNIERPVRVFMARGNDMAPSAASASTKAPVASDLTRRPCIAVLPFDNMSGDPEQEYFSDGITEDIITDLAKVSALSVVARNSTFTFKGRPVLIGEAAKRLNADFVLEGSVRKAASQVRITAQLIDGHNGQHIWAERYDRPLDDIFALQDEISKSIVDSLKVRLLPKELEMITKRSTDNAEAYQIFLMGRSFFNRGHETRNMKAAQHLFAKALDVDPNYARAYAGLADCESYLLLANDPSASFDKVMVNASRALQLEPDLADAHLSQAIAHFVAGNRGQAEREFNRAIALDPDSFEAYFFYARNCHVQGWFDKAVELYRQAIAHKPDEYRSWDQLRAAYVSLGREAEAVEAARQALQLIEKEVDLHPDEPNLLCYGATLMGDLGDIERGVEWTTRAAALAGDDLRVLYNLGCCYSKLGELETAIDCLERQASGAPAYVARMCEWMPKDSDMEPLRDHPRFQALLARMNALSEQPAQSL